MLGEIGQRHRPGVIDEHVNGAVGVYSELRHVEHIVLLGHVSDNISRFATGGLDLVNDGLELLLVARGEDDLAAQLGGALRGQQAEAAGRAGDDYHLALYIVFLDVVALVIHQLFCLQSWFSWHICQTLC